MASDNNTITTIGPIIYCGNDPGIAQGMIELLKPDIEVMHAILSPRQGAYELSSILAGQGLPPYIGGTDGRGMGTQQYDRRPVAIVTGAGYDDTAFQTMRDACVGVSEVPWLKHNLLYRGGPPPGQPGYADSVAERVKEGLRGLEREGRMGRDGVYLY